VRVLRISGGESAIAFFQPRDRLSGRNNWLIGMSRISRSGKLVHPNQTNEDDAGREMCFFHTAIYEGTELFVQFES
jgi:hypothetical protein